jgi:hypothetical protein
MLNTVTMFIARLGVLRVALLISAVTTMILAPPPATAGVYTGWAFVPTVLVPVLAPLILMVLLLDTMMSAIFMIDKDIAERRRYRMIIVTHLLLVLALVARWSPYFLAL